MPTYPSRFQGALYALGELARCLASTHGLDWVTWYSKRLADQTLGEARRRTLGAMLAGIARKRSDPCLALSTWVNGRDLWVAGLRSPAIAILACESALWLKDDGTYEAAFAAGNPLFSESTRLRLEFLRDMYRSGKTANQPRKVHLPPGLPHDPALPFVDYYARARAADSANRLDVAREHYLRALQTMPVDHEAYAFARNRDYEIRNLKYEKI